jgi:hypothetical protein
MIKWNELPQEIQERMLEEQELQGNKKDATVFIKNVKECAFDGGFDWGKSVEDFLFWVEILDEKNIEHFYTLYPKKPQSQYPKVMWVSDLEDFSDKRVRVVFMEKLGKFLAWDGAETLEEAREKLQVVPWDYAKDIETVKSFSIEEAIQALAEKNNLKVSEIKIILKIY